MGRDREPQGDPPPLPEESVRYGTPGHTVQPARKPAAPPMAQPTSTLQEDHENLPYTFYVVIVALTLASIVFVIIMLAFRNVFTEVALVTTALSTLFGIFGTVVGAYFGIKSSV
jgi:hypothetical protein